ncbi:hypothetical protein [Blastococcus sp. VKM Ac-2987]|uniref:hypothetical protein n=1 Tax=Blastococcus sp. VKM Ac-2987 TaxID=3004141 RepID=UPI0022AB72DB|nr:hypothetical protein [Blastococcus sp. VKM Ac-2987]MCZ2857739.1 hypothetical protein [Blastococcus sp. VKM Ac-2987]
MPNVAGVDRKTAEDGLPVFHELLRWMERTAVPTSRPETSAADEAAGLVILDLSLRLEHVSRVTDSLRVIDKSHVRRLVTLDVDLRGLTGEQRAALTVRRGLIPPDASTEADGATHLWVPVSRHSRMDLSPVVVRDASDQVLPRLTQRAASKTLVAGLSRLLKLIRGSRADRLTPKSMWLIIRALESLIEEGPIGRDSPEPPPTSADGAGRRPVEDAHADARAFLAGMPPDLQQSLDRLIEVAYTEYVLVVMLPAKTSQSHLQFEAPLIPAALQSRSRLLQMTPGREYTIDYRTEIARSLGSYHVTVEVAEEIYVRRYILCSDVDKAAVADLGREMKDLSTALEQRGRSGPEEVEEEALWLELEAVVSKLVQLGRRRNLEYRRYCRYIENQELGSASLDSPGADPSGDPKDSPLAALARGDVSLAQLDELADLLATRTFRDCLETENLRPGHFTLGLPRIAGWLSDARLGEEILVENDPRENGAHAQWRHQPLGFGTPSLEPIRARVFLTLADERPALADSVFYMLLGLFGIVVGLGAVLQFSGTAKKDIQADALVAVLLLVPGILLARLDIPNTNSVLGQLRAVPRNVAYFSVILTSGLAVAVATAWAPPPHLLPWVEDHLAPYVWVAAALFLCWLFSAAEKGQRRRRRNRSIPASADVPWWLRNHTGGPAEALQTEERSADVVFDAIDARPVQVARWDRRVESAWDGVGVGKELAALEQALPWPWPWPWSWGVLAEENTSARADRRTSTSRRSLRGAELARAAARAVTAGRSGVELVVEHSSDTRSDTYLRRRVTAGPWPNAGATGTPSRAVDASWTPSPDEPIEALTSREGHFTVRVRARPLNGAIPDRPQMTSAASTAAGGSYVLAAPLGPGAFARTLSTFHFLIEVTDGARGAELLERLLDGSARPGSVDMMVRELEYPGAPRASHSETAAAGPRGRERHVLRLSVALPDGEVTAGAAAASRRESDLPKTDGAERRKAEEQTPGQSTGRLALTRYLAGLCAEMDARLYVTDAATGAGPHWRPVVRDPRPGNGTMCASEPWDADAAIVDGRRHDGHVALVTMAGSTTGYDVGAAVSMCSLVKKAGVDVVSVSVTRLLDQPLVSLVLRRPTAPPPSSAGSPHDATSRPALASLAGFLAISPRDHDLMGAVEGRALMVTRLDVPQTCCQAEARTGSPPETLWLQWSWPGSHADHVTLDPAELVQDAVADARVVHQRFRRDRDGRVKGDARLVVTEPRGEALGKRAYAVERTVQQDLARTHRSPHEVQLRVVRNEGWLSQD